LIDSVPDKFYTDEAKLKANQKVKICRDYYNSLVLEVDKANYLETGDIEKYLR